MKVKRQSELLGITTDFLVVDCRQQGLKQCRVCGKHSLVVIASSSHQLRWCSNCVGQLTLTCFDEGNGSALKTKQQITKWVDNGSVQLIETPGRTLIITFREQPELTRAVK